MRACGIVELAVPPDRIPPTTQNRGKEITWELAELNFRAELFALDARASGLHRNEECLGCFESVSGASPPVLPHRSITSFRDPVFRHAVEGVTASPTLNLPVDRQWNDDVPKPLRKARTAARRVLQEAYAAVIPSPKTCVLDVLHELLDDLTLFLSSEWLNDEMINAGADYILRRWEPGSRTRILNCLFISSLRTGRKKRSSYDPPNLSPVEKAIRAGQVDALWFPLTHLRKLLDAPQD
ncbi:hypothetical protein DFH06DRAFT_1321208 [Mycena polygramma]|nr:hypothetical protein DFH06DRAFT_1321208 [Mycena polygramma]